MPYSSHFVLSAVAAAIFASSTAFASDTPFIFTDPALGGYQMPYHLLLPSDYNPSGPAIPVILFLHGSGERGSDNSLQFAHIGNLINETQGAVPAHDAILILPQCPSGEVWNGINAGDHFAMGSYTNAQQQPVTNALHAAMDILAQVEATTDANTRKVYISGLSMGGYGSWDAITQFPNTFAAAMPMSGGGNRDAGALLKNTPVWAYHGAADGVVPASGDTDMIDAINTAGGHPIYSLIPGYDHGNWEEFLQPDHWTTGNPTGTGGPGLDVYDWLFSQSLPVPEPASLVLLMLASPGLLLRRRRQPTAKPDV